MENELCRNVTFKVSPEMMKQIGQEAMRRNIGIADMMRLFVAEKLEDGNRPVDRT